MNSLYLDINQLGYWSYMVLRDCLWYFIMHFENNEIFFFQFWIFKILLIYSFFYFKFFFLFIEVDIKCIFEIYLPLWPQCWLFFYVLIPYSLQHCIGGVFIPILFLIINILILIQWLIILYFKFSVLRFKIKMLLLIFPNLLFFVRFFFFFFILLFFILLDG